MMLSFKEINMLLENFNTSTFCKKNYIDKNVGSVQLAMKISINVFY